MPVQETSPANPALPQQGAGGSGAGGSGIAEEDCHMAEVDAANENGHFARWGVRPLRPRRSGVESSQAPTFATVFRCPEEVV